MINDRNFFFQALSFLADKNIDFRIAILGERYQRIPAVFPEAKQTFGSRIVQYGYVESRAEYYQWLRAGDIVVSTADQENFGISVVEAIRHGCLPLVPNRLSYPEVIPDEFQSLFLYHDQNDFSQKLLRMVLHPDHFFSYRDPLSESMEKFSWEKRIEVFDDFLNSLQKDSDIQKCVE